MSTSAIARRYAKALVELGTEQKMVEQYGTELAGVKALLSRETALRQIVESPSLQIEKKSAILAEIMEKMQLSAGMRKFLGLLVTKDRLKYLSQIEGNYRDFADELSGVLRARLVAAADLDAAQQQAIGAGLEKVTGKTVKLKVEVNPALIGGLTAEIGGRVFDGSIKTQLQRVEDTLKKG